MHTQAFWYFFHLLTGAIMVIGYALFFDNIKTSVFRKGLLFSLFPWIINGVVILPLLHQGIMGIGTLPLSGIIYYFFANAIFGLSLAYLYNGLKKNHE
jgi:hypothetical protein